MTEPPDHATVAHRRGTWRAHRPPTTGHDLEGLLAAVLQAAREAVENLHSVGVVLLEGTGRPRPRTSGDPVAQQLDLLQHSVQQGPGWHSCLRATDVFVEDLQDADSAARWPHLTAATGDLPVRAVMSVHLSSPGGPLGCLTLVADRPGAFDDGAQVAAQVLAATASLPLAAALQRERLASELAARAVVGQATGLLVERLGVTPDHAATLMQEASARTGTTVRQVAEEVARTSTAPGADRPTGRSWFPGAGPVGLHGVAAYRSAFLAWPVPGALLDPDLVFVDANDAYVVTSARPRGQLVGRYFFDVFPDEEGLGEASPHGIALRTALRSGQLTREPLVSYPIRVGGRVHRRWWSVLNTPVLDAEGEVTGVFTTVEDLTELMAEQDASRLARAVAEDLRRRSDRLTTDLHARYQDLREVRQAEARASRRLAALAEVTLGLAGAETVEALTDVVVAGLSVLGADGGAIGVPDQGGGHLHVHLSESLGGTAERVRSLVPMTAELPMTVAARTGRAVLLGDRATGAAFSADMALGYEMFGRQAWAGFPLQVGGRTIGAVAISWASPQDFGDADLELLTAFVAQCAQALDRVLRWQGERSAAAVSRQMSEALQRSLLTPPAQPEHLQVAARYVPAVHDVQVGGDWYDAFLVGDGSTQLVVGDVSGHGREAAATMGQLRNVLRGIAHTAVEPPAAVLRALERASADLGITALVTAVLATIDPTPDEAGMRTLRWSNAGHPPPVLVRPTGEVEVLWRPVDRLLGATEDTPRHDHTIGLAPGSIVLFFTDGLVERRRVPLDAGFEWLRATAEAFAAQDLPFEQWCDRLLHELGDEVDDDVVVLAVRVRPEDQPRPPRPGPTSSPASAGSSTG